MQTPSQKPDPEFNLNSWEDTFFFRMGEKDEEEKEDEEEDNEGIENDEEAPDKDNDNSKKGDNMNTTPNENPSEQEPPQLNEAHFNYTDIADAIDQLSLCSGPGPDGISAISVKDYSVIDVE